jgi:hypothetical protein
MEGGYSLRIQTAGAGQHILGLTTGATITTGKVRSLVKLSSLGDSASVARALGVFGMMQSSLAYGSNAYWAQIRGTATSNPFLTQVGLVKGGIDASFLSGTTATKNANKDAVVCIELLWQKDTGTGQILLTGSVGNATDFSDLAVFGTYTDNSSPYSAGVSAGIMASSGGGDQYFLHDITQIFRV